MTVFKSARYVAYALTGSLLISACDQGPSATEHVAEGHVMTATGQLVYGADDRLEYHDGAVPAAHKLLADSTMVMVYNTQLTSDGSGGYDIGGWLTLADRFLQHKPQETLCASEPFADQPDPGYCTGFLIADDLVATAGHCISNDADCADLSFVFGFVMDAPGAPRLNVPAQDVRPCLEVIETVQTISDDYAVFRIAPVSHRAPLPIRTSGKIADDAPLLLVGHPVGLPVKIAGSPLTLVRENTEPDNFQANVDSYGGNSGSPVFNLNTLEVEGILVAGQVDFVTIGQGGDKCTQSNVCSDAAGCNGSWETITRSTNFAHLLGPPAADCAFVDAHEPNDSSSDGGSLPILLNPTEAPYLTERVIDTLSVCDASEDWFRVWAPAGETFTATINFAHADGDLTLEIWDTFSLVDSSNGTTGQEVASGARTSEGSMYARVQGFGGAANTYSLTLRIGDQTDITALGQGCWDSGDTRAGGTLAMGCGPSSAPRGALRLTTAEGAVADKATVDLRDWSSTGSCTNAATGNPIDEQLSSITGLDYTWLVSSDGTFSWAAPSLKLIIDTVEANGTSSAKFETVGDKILVYEAYLQAGAMIAEDVWLAESITDTDGRWWLVDLTPGGSPALGSISRSDLKTLGEWSALFEFSGLIGGTIASLQVGVGSNNKGLISYVDGVGYGSTSSSYTASFGDSGCVGVRSSASSVIKATANFLDRGVGTSAADADIRLDAGDVAGATADDKNAALATLAESLHKAAKPQGGGKGVFKRIDRLEDNARGVLSGDAAKAYERMLNRARSAGH
ncbi:MAG: hypothetical protein ACI9MR_004472 [Myxococcota bacterium]|jgi:hypothetical protein